jgi:hypothetical protein
MRIPLPPPPFAPAGNFRAHFRLDVGKRENRIREKPAGPESRRGARRSISKHVSRLRPDRRAAADLGGAGTEGCSPRAEGIRRPRAGQGFPPRGRLLAEGAQSGLKPRAKSFYRMRADPRRSGDIRAPCPLRLRCARDRRGGSSPPRDRRRRYQAAYRAPSRR